MVTEINAALPLGKMPNGSACLHEGETSTYCTRCWMNLYKASNPASAVSQPLDGAPGIAADVAKEKKLQRFVWTIVLGGLSIVWLTYSYAPNMADGIIAIGLVIGLGILKVRDCPHCGQPYRWTRHACWHCGLRMPGSS